MKVENAWYLVSSHGSILFYIAAFPDTTVKDIADAMSLTRRTVWGIIGDLRRKDMIDVRRDGRHHHYTVNLDPDVKFTHPTLKDIPWRTVLGELVKNFVDGGKQ